MPCNNAWFIYKAFVWELKLEKNTKQECIVYTDRHPLLIDVKIACVNTNV